MEVRRQAVHIFGQWIDRVLVSELDHGRISATYMAQQTATPIGPEPLKSTSVGIHGWHYLHCAVSGEQLVSLGMDQPLLCGSGRPDLEIANPIVVPFSSHQRLHMAVLARASGVAKVDVIDGSDICRLRRITSEDLDVLHSFNTSFSLDDAGQARIATAAYKPWQRTSEQAQHWPELEREIQAK